MKNRFCTGVEGNRKKDIFYSKDKTWQKIRYMRRVKLMLHEQIQEKNVHMHRNYDQQEEIRHKINERSLLFVSSN